ncbi:F-box/WD repeat-containing protein 8, partial [Biomphalaria glabrata]
VSRSWRSLADDELLWFRIYQESGFGQDLYVGSEENWKSIVQRHIQNQRLQIANWKARIGKPYHLTFPRGGILCATHSHNTSIVAGYTSCHVRLWNTETGDVCTFNASNTALVLDEQAEELGRIHNEIKCVRTTPLITAASFKHGFVDVWKNEGGTECVQTIRFNNQEIASLSTLDINQHCSLVAAAQGSRVKVAVIGGEETEKVFDFEMNSQVTQVDWLTSGHSHDSSLLLLTYNNSVFLKKIHASERDSMVQSQDDIELHNIIWAPITTVGFRDNDHDVAVGFNLYAPSTQVKLNVYDISSNQLKISFTGHTWLISCVHLPTLVPHQLVTGSADRKIRQYDDRAGLTACYTLIGHAAKVNTVQMDDWKIVSGDDGGFVYVWDQRMCRKLWDIYNRHPVGYCHFDDRMLIISNIPYQKFPHQGEFETVSSLRYRGTVQVYDFMANQQTQGVPDICLSSYNEPEASDYNIGLTVPYDSVD